MSLNRYTTLARKHTCAHANSRLHLRINVLSTHIIAMLIISHMTHEFLFLFCLFVCCFFFVFFLFFWFIYFSSSSYWYWWCDLCRAMWEKFPTCCSRWRRFKCRWSSLFNKVYYPKVSAATQVLKLLYDIVHVWINKTPLYFWDTITLPLLRLSQEIIHLFTLVNI